MVALGWAGIACRNPAAARAWAWRRWYRSPRPWGGRCWARPDQLIPGGAITAARGRGPAPWMTSRRHCRRCDCHGSAAGWCRLGRHPYRLHAGPGRSCRASSTMCRCRGGGPVRGAGGGRGAPALAPGAGGAAGTGGDRGQYPDRLDKRSASVDFSGVRVSEIAAAAWRGRGQRRATSTCWASADCGGGHRQRGKLPGYHRGVPQDPQAVRQG